ncbi:tetratricopeptide repeat protein, partial [Thermodesulfobacteriota bacterium]
IMKKNHFYLLSRQSFFRRGVHIFLLIVITSIVFSNTLDNSHHLDSVYRVKNNTEINKFWPPARFFTDVRIGSTNPKIAEYRPMMPLSHAINSEIARATGTSKLAGFHVGNIAIHIGSAILVYFLFCLLIGSWGRVAESETKSIHYSHQAFAAALIFAIHPIAGSAVNYIAARDLLLMVFFFLASMRVYFGMRRTGDTVSGWLISLLLLCLAILSKQSAIIGFGLVFLFEWVLADVKLKDWKLWARTILFGIPTAAYFLLHRLWISQQNPSDSLRTVKDFTYLFTMLDAHLFYYLRNFVWPFEMRALGTVEMIKSILEPSALIGLLFIVITLVVAWLLRKRHPLITFAILAYWLLFSLTSSIFPFRYVVTDYRQYLPLVFLSLTVTMLVFSSHRKTLTVIFLSSLVLYFSVSSYFINTHWKTEESFWRQSVKYGARALAHNNYGLVISKKNEKLAEQHYQEALRQNPYHIYANINLGMLHIHMGKKAEGLQRLRRVVALNPKWALAYYWLSVGLKSTGQVEESLKPIQHAADLDPRSLRYQYAAARALQDAGKRSEAIPYFQRIIGLDPDYELTGFWLGFAYQKTGQLQNAIDTYNRFLQRNPDHVQGHFNLAYALMAANDCKTAVVHFNKALELRPSYLETHQYLARCYRILGNEELAAHHAAIGQSGE